MTPEDQAQLQQCVDTIASILYRNTPAEQLQTLEGIEQAIRTHAQQSVLPQLGVFFIAAATGTTDGYQRTLKSILGRLSVTSEQAQRLDVKAGSQLSPMLERCCLRVSANVSYQHAAQDVELFTGVTVSAKTQQRLVQRQTFAPPTVDDPVAEASIDGGTVRLVVEPGQKPLWKQYKAVHLAPMGVCAAWFDDNAALLAWFNHQLLAVCLVCLGDGHDGIWNLFAQLTDAVERREILDWFHLMENLEKVGGSLNRLADARRRLWQGKVDETLTLFEDCQLHQAQCFCQYLHKHRHRIVNYEYYQSEGICSIGSGAVESTVKQIDRRLQISGARWKAEHVPNVLAHRCAYLNNLL
ncbi:ISKra4 family transposase [Leptodesmis sichuanensis]|uniref:ISKra4 family transposase n=1 Tax=Leptodesmis sichuanensis TaxID=2906798 RepID=UPI001F40C99E|nr:ISKra4 family transposase [Leptodesmis sichuanensis]UIE37002.1 ISKra4 family transposase [Leptodesmis sichuanensis A121]